MRQSIEGPPGTTRDSPWARFSTFLGLLLLVAFGALVAVLPAVLSAERAAALVFDPPVLMLILNTLLLFGVSLVVLTVSARAYLASGAFSLLLLGCGALFLGSAALVGGWVKPLGGSANASVTVHNLGVLIAAVLHAAGALVTFLKVEPEHDRKRRGRNLQIGLAAAVALIVLYSRASVGSHLPPFWTAGTGSTVLKQAVLGTAEILFLLSAVYLMILYFRAGPRFLYWYSLALVLTAFGLQGITLMKAVGDPIGWAGRVAQYVGGTLLLAAALEALAAARAAGTALEGAIDRFYLLSEAHYRDLVESVGDAILSIDHTKKVLLWNRGAERMLGYSRAEATGRPVADLLMPAGQAEWFDSELEDLVAKHQDGTSLREIEVRIRRRDGSLIPTLTSISLRRTDANWTATMVVRDITERKAAEGERSIASDFLAMTNAAPGTRELVREAVSFLRSRSGCSAVGVRLKKGDSYPLYEARGFPRQPGPPEDGLCRGNCAAGDADGFSAPGCLCPRVIRGRFDPGQQNLTPNGSFWTNRAKGSGLDHSREDCLITGFESLALLPLTAGTLRLGLLQLGDPRSGLLSPMRMALWERLAGHLGVALAKTLAEEELRGLNERLEGQVAERTATAERRALDLQELAAQLIEAEEQERRRISELLHNDLQQILVGARLQLQAAQATLPAQPLLGRVDKLLGESIAKSRRLSHDLSPAILHHAGLRPALQWLAQQMKEQHGLTVGLEAEAVGPDDPEEEEPLRPFLYRAVQELLFNIVKHAGARSACIRLEKTAERLRVSVSDSGQGMNPEMAKLPVTNPGGPLRGSGLFTIGERIRAVGGALEIQSEPGAGTRITLSIPRVRRKRVAQPPAAFQASTGEASPEPCGQGTPASGHLFRVLLVDDHKVMRQGLIALINGQPDIRVVGEASDGVEAIELARELRPDVIVMDAVMPRLNGVEATRRIKQEMPEVHIIGLSMLEDEQIDELMLAAGAEAFVSKANSAGSLLRAIYGLGERASGEKP